VSGPRGLARAGGFLRSYLGRGAAVREEETTVLVHGEPHEATLFLPERGGRVPGWVVMHGLTVPGRHHAGMLRFVRALCASGAAVLVPDVPPWRALRLDVNAARAALSAAALQLADHPRVKPGGVGTVGFSFGATQALIAAAEPEVGGALTTVLGFGGYCDPARMIRCLFTGEHEWRGRRMSLIPDPYGRWILTGNFLTMVPEYAHMARVERAAMELALEAGRRGAFAWEGEYDDLKASLREGLDEEERGVWDVVASPAHRLAEGTPEAHALAERFAEQLPKHHRGLDPRGFLPRLRGHVILSHGRADRLIPYTETLRLRELMPPQVDLYTAVTGLFAHSTGAALRHPLEWAGESTAFVRLLSRALGSV
jgi:hypothetical protein